MRYDPQNAGVYRKENVFISGSDFVPTDYRRLGEEMASFKDRVLSQVNHPIEEAATAHMELAHVHPFIDGNGRTARLLMNLILIKNGYPVVIVPPILRGEYTSCCADYNEGKERLIY